MLPVACCQCCCLLLNNCCCWCCCLLAAVVVVAALAALRCARALANGGGRRAMMGRARMGWCGRASNVGGDRCGRRTGVDDVDGRRRRVMSSGGRAQQWTAALPAILNDVGGCRRRGRRCKNASVTMSAGGAASAARNGGAMQCNKGKWRGKMAIWWQCTMGNGRQWLGG